MELARYERAEQEVALSVETLQSDMAQGRFGVCGRGAGQIVGMALHHARTARGRLDWYLEDLVVTEAWRGRCRPSLFLAVAATRGR